VETTVEGSRAGRRRRRRLVAIGLVAAIAVAAAVVFRGPLFAGNFAVVDPGRAFRSAQPRTAEDFGRLIEGRGLATILNLRGGSRADPWYVAEVEATAARGVDFYDLPMSATARPSRRDLVALVDVLASCRKPLLIHCKSGSDRTGLAATLYRLVVLGEPPEAARRAFALEYGHVALGGTERLHEPIDEYAAHLAASGQLHTPSRFRDWLARTYRSDDPPGERSAMARPGPRAPAPR